MGMTGCGAQVNTGIALAEDMLETELKELK